VKILVLALTRKKPNRTHGWSEEEEDYKWGSQPDGLEAPCAEKEGEGLHFRSFYVILNLEVGRKSVSPMACWLGEDLVRLMHTPMLIVRYPKSKQEEISTLNLQDLQLKWSSWLRGH
jgi:hypothetical protein